MWEEHYKTFLNLPINEAEIAAKRFVHQMLNLNDFNVSDSLPQSHEELVMAQAQKLKNKCAPGRDDICAEHLSFSHLLIYIHLSLLLICVLCMDKTYTTKLHKICYNSCSKEQS